MGKHLLIKQGDDEAEYSHPGCMWGIFHALDYHHWHYNVKKMLLHKKHHQRGRQVKRNESPIMNLNIHDASEGQNLSEDEASRLYVGQSSVKSKSTNKRSLKARIKTLIAEEMSKKEVCKQNWGLSEPSKMQRTYSIHHLESSDYSVDGTSTECKLPIILVQNNSKTTAINLKDPAQIKDTDKLAMDGAMNWLKPNQLVEDHAHSQDACVRVKETPISQSKDASYHLPRDDGGVLEIFQVNKELFLKILQSTDNDIAEGSNSILASNLKGRLTKSGSFPIADFGYTRNSRPSNLKHKQNEIWSSPKREKLLANYQATKLLGFKSWRTRRTKSVPLMDDVSGSSINQQTSIASFNSTQELDTEENSQVVIDSADTEERAVLFRKVKCRSDSEALDGHINRAPDKCDPSKPQTDKAVAWDSNEMSEDGKNGSSNFLEIGGSIYDLNKNMFTYRRASSLNESLDKYSRLFEYCSNSRELKLPLSKSLKLTNDYETPSSVQPASKYFRSISYLPHLDSFISSSNEVPPDAHSSGKPIISISDGSRNTVRGCEDIKIRETNDIKETEPINNMVERSSGTSTMKNAINLTVDKSDENTTKVKLNGNLDDPIIGEIDAKKYQQIASTDISSSKPLQLTSALVLERCLEEAIGLANNAVSEDLDWEWISLEAKEVLSNSYSKTSTDSSSHSCSSLNHESFENANRGIKHSKLKMENGADLNYVREILARSGFIRNGLLETWNPFYMPLNPSVYEELESCWPHETERTSENMYSCWHHLLLFDLVDEVLLQIYDRSFTDYPKALSFGCRVRTMPRKNQLLEEFWAIVGGYLRLRPELYPSLDCVVAQDMERDDGWMNLQSESKCVGLEIEGLIFNELLDDITSQ